VRPYHKNPITKNRAGGWAKVKALSSSPSTTKKKIDDDEIDGAHNWKV
jgi:hypothetical protein